MRKGFSLLELIFVIILMGVLSGIGFYLSRPDYSRQDAQYTLLKLKEARYRALGYNVPIPDPAGCVTLTPTALSDTTAPAHEIRSAITLSDPSITTVCFDGEGRPHSGNSIALNTLLRTPLTATFSTGGKNAKISLYPQTGYAIISCN